MCADKIRRTLPLKITFSSGEQPTASKLTAVAQQARNGVNILEYAIGDVWNESGDSILSSFELQIPNIARMIGQNKLLNPALYHLHEAFTFTERFGSRNFQKHSGFLLYEPASTITVSNADNIVGTIQEDDPESIDYNVNNTHYNTVTNKLEIFTIGGFGVSDKLSYSVDPDSWMIGNEYLPSVIPDPRQTTFTRCRLSKDNGKYYIHLPPRVPLSLNNNERPYRYPSSSEVALTENLGTVPGTPGSPSTYKMFHSPSVDAIADKHYRYRFPKEIEDALGSLLATDTLPTGLLYLWDHTNETIVRDVVFYKSDKTDGTEEWTLRITSDSASTDFDTVAAALPGGEDETSYGSNARYSLITVGASIANTLRYLYNMSVSHDHNDPSDLSSVISHSSLADDEPDNSVFVGSPNFSISPAYWSKDPHVGLLHRAGTGFSRDMNDNAMLGDLVIASSSAEADGNRLRTDALSYKLYFGSTSGPSLYYDNSVTGLVFTGTAAYHQASFLYSGLTTGQSAYIKVGQISGITGELGFNYNTTTGDRYTFLLNEGDVATTKSLALRKGGNVGIGTVSPTEKLDVDGNVKISGTLTTTGNVNGRDMVADGIVIDGFAGGAVTSFNTRTGAVVPVTNDYTWAQINKTTSNIADITTRAHSSLQSIGIDDHHAKSHAHNGSDGSGTVAHSDLTGISANQHHNESHTIASHSDTSGTGAELNTLTDGSNADSLHVHTTYANHIAAASPHSSHVIVGSNPAANRLAIWSSSTTVQGNSNLTFTGGEFKVANNKILIEESSSTVFSPTSDGLQSDDVPTLHIYNPNTTINTVAQIAFTLGNSGVAGARIAALRQGNGYSDIAFTTEHNYSNDERMRITSEGRLGIGTNNPSYTLDVASTARVTQGFYVRGNTTENDYIEIGAGRTGNGTTFIDFISEANENDYNFRIVRNSGVNGSAEIRQLGTGALLLNAYDAGKVQLGTNNLTRMTVTSDGKVGIGETNPTEELEIATDTDATAIIGRAKVGYVVGSDIAAFSHVDRGTSLAYALKQESDGVTRINAPSTASVGISLNNVTHIQVDDTNHIQLKDQSIVTTDQLNDFAFIVDNTNQSGYGMKIRCGADTPSSLNDCLWIRLSDGNDSSVAQLGWKSDGADWGTPDRIAWYHMSDISLKENIQPTNINGLEIINNLPLRQFDWKDANRGHNDIGYIAQEVQQVYPKMVMQDQETDLLMVADECLTPVLVKAIQEQQELIEELKNRIIELENKVS